MANKITYQKLMEDLIKEKLGEYASYDEIRFVFEVYKKHIPA